MSDNPKNTGDMAAVAHSIGQLSGELKVMHQSTMDAINVIRQDLRRMEDSTKESMQHLENRLNDKIGGLGKRVENLEKEEKDTIATKAKHGVFAGGAGAALTYGFIELIKRIH